MSNEYYKKYEKKLLICIYKMYVKECGNQLSQLDAWKFSSLDPLIFELTPEILIKSPAPIIANSDARYLGNLKEYNYISAREGYFRHLTKEGFYEAKRLIHPYRYFFIKYWKYIISTSLTFILLLVTIIRLTICK